MDILQSENGLWHTVLDDTVSYCEVSAAGFSYGILLGIRLGLIGKDYEECTIKAAKAVINKVAEDGTVTDVSTGTGIQKTAKMYRDMDKSVIMPWGQGLALLMLIRYESYCRKKLQ